MTVNCVAPGRINTAQILDRIHPDEASRQDFVRRNMPMGRFGEAEEAAALIAFLVSDAARYITGTTIPVDGRALRYAFRPPTRRGRPSDDLERFPIRSHHLIGKKALQLKDSSIVFPLGPMRSERAML